ncbi:hybrid sensor histidine kinase/response regulator [Allosphingosinicella deserti]|uniref:histidine kinase n=1 Tax=Allosphingosinicella deserti TaxID=2116704 RepID=A0A2P7QS82_9SPHN|nr:PAS domain-containing sensor histidine kinase [Sphingomonas deserti]PSJ40822.1 hybrid sensor histidine kinase/response regulator [Sphingomonas deserti]
MADATRFESHLTEERFRLLVNAVTDYALYMLDPEGRIATWNPGARRFKGYEADEIIGRNFSSFFTDEDRAAGLPQRALATAAREGKFEAEGWRVRKDGTRFWAHVVLDPIRDDHGHLIGFAKITRDVTERKQADEALRESERRFRLLVQGVRDYAIYMLDPDGRVTNWNSGAEAIKGYSAGEIVGQHFSQFYTDEDRACGEPARALATALGAGKYEKEAWRLRKDGTRFMASVVIDPIYDDAGRHIGFAKVTRDVTERYLAQQELEETRMALLQSQKLQALGELTGGIAHDFNNLMTVIRGSADLLRRETLSDEKRRRYLDAITETADRAAMLTSHLLAFGRRQALKPEVVALNVRLDAFGEVLSRTLGGSIQVQLDLAPSLWPVEVDSTQLETALLNAAFNARDAMPNGGSIVLSTANRSDADGDWVCISLRDTGEGMSDEVKARVFEPFFTTKPVGRGTGLGLSQIHGFAAQSGGRAEIDSRLGEGTTIRLLLPRTTNSAAPADGTPQAIEPSRTLKVLLVEDNDHVREFAATLLEDLGHTVIQADEAEAALSILARDPVDILFSDVVMPGISGVELARRARANRPELPVLLASGYSDEIIAGAGAEFDFVHKPYDAQQLGLALNAASEKAGTSR